MREIKFRAFDSKRKCIWHPDMYIVRGDNIVPHMVIDPCEDDIIMQYTGLLDFYGKEVFEGDVIREYTPLDAIFGPENILYEIRYHGDGFYFYNITLDSIISNFNLRHIVNRYEVIGNIYENSSLVKKNPTVQ